MKFFIVNQKVFQLKNNILPRGLVHLERLFNSNDVAISSKKIPQDEHIQDYNIGIEEEPRLIKLFDGVTLNYKERYLKLFKDYINVFAWSYEDLKTYDTSFIQHKIPLKEGIKIFKLKLRQINPLLLPSIEKEVKKLLDAKIIVPLRYSDWVANLVPVRKKKGEIRLCVDFRNLNRDSLKYHYPLPKMDLVLQKVIESFRMSMLDGFSRYNQFVVDKEDWKKTGFTTPWGNFMYARMPFGLMSVGATFQRAMDISFVGDKFVVIYLADITFFSKSDEEHLKHLKNTF